MKLKSLLIKTLVVTIGLGSTMYFTSCKKQVEEFVEKYTFDVRVTNNTADHLTIFESSDDGKNYEDLGAVSAGATSLKRGFPINTDLTVEARKDDGSVYATKEFREGSHKELEWIID